VEIGIELLTQDERIADLCTRFWKYENGKFAFRADVLAKEWGGGMAGLSKLVRENCSVTASFPCGYCRSVQNVKVKTRGDFGALSLVCPSCRQKQADEWAEKEEEEQQKLAAALNRFLSGQLSSRTQSDDEQNWEEDEEEYYDGEVHEGAAYEGDPEEIQQENSAAVHVELEDISQVVRFVNLTKYSLDLDCGQTVAAGDGSGEEKLSQATLSLSGTVELGAPSPLIRGGAFRYLVNVNSDGSFDIYRVQVQPSGRSSVMLISAGCVSGGRSIRDELQGDLIAAISADFKQKKRRV
jgi:hypothetical protein